MPSGEEQATRSILLPTKLPPAVLAVGSAAWRGVAWWSNVDFLLSIRDEKAFVMFSLFLNYGWLALIAVGCVWAFFQKPAERPTITSPALVVVVGVLAFVWGVLLTVLATASVPAIFGSWGSLSGAPECVANIDTTRILSFRKTYDVALVCGFSDPARDKLTDPRISLSNLFIIRAEPLSITMPYSKEMKEAIEKITVEVRKAAKLPKDAPVAVNVWYEAVLIKKGADMNKIHTLSDIVHEGGKILRQQYFE